MKRISITKDLFVDEYIPEDMYNSLMHKPYILIGLLDKQLIIADQMLRDKFGPVNINTWYTGGTRTWSGLRTTASSYYSATSQHTYGRASDKIFQQYESDEVREYIKKHWKELGITAIEKGVSWVHSDTRLIKNQKKLLIF